MNINIQSVILQHGIAQHDSKFSTMNNIETSQRIHQRGHRNISDNLCRRPGNKSVLKYWLYIHIDILLYEGTIYVYIKDCLPSGFSFIKLSQP